ncbi:MAG: NAD-dependent isocitrate dehydrogenase [Rhodobacterales bacterium]|nr:NAD-dependent isocitrate dehydrogenase [Rhodobacterales bacterium]
MSYAVTLVPGDVPETLAPVQAVIAATGVQIDWHIPEAGLDALTASVKETGTALIGWRCGERADGIAPPAVSLRKALEVYVQERPIRSVLGLKTRHENVDLIVVRETTEDVYAMLEHETIPNVFESLKITTRAACERVVRHAFVLAQKQGRKKVTLVHKANIMKLSDGMFLRVGLEVAKDSPDIQVEDAIVDALCMRIVLNPSQFDVLVCGNLFGDIVADLAAGLVGGNSNAPSINHTLSGPTLFTAGHGDLPEIAGTGRDNALPLLLPAVHLLRHLGEADAAERLQTAIGATLTAGVLPCALGGEVGATAFCAAVVEQLA